MQDARLGNSGLVVSRLALGVMTSGHDEGPLDMEGKANWFPAFATDAAVRDALAESQK